MEVSTHVDGSLAGSAAVPEAQPQAGADPRGGGSSSQEPSMAAGMPLADLNGLPFMLVGPPQSYALAPRGKLRSLSGEVSAGDSGGGMSNVGPQAGNGSGGTASVSSVGSAPQAVPEPFTILLTAPALALALRRRLQRRG